MRSQSDPAQPARPAAHTSAPAASLARTPTIIRITKTEPAMGGMVAAKPFAGKAAGSASYPPPAFLGLSRASCGTWCRGSPWVMRSTLPILVALLAGCAPVPPGDVVGGHAEWIGRWTDPAPTYTGEVRLCFADDDGLHVTAGPDGQSITIVLEGDWTQAEWDAVVSPAGAYVRPNGASFLAYPFYECEAHVGTGNGEWVIDMECTAPDLSAHVVVTGCERR